LGALQAMALSAIMGSLKLLPRLAGPGIDVGIAYATGR